MIHLRIDGEPENNKRRFACGLGPELPPGDTYLFEGEVVAAVAIDCAGCNPHAWRPGTPISEISTQRGTRGYDNWLRISQSWGYD